MARIALLKLLLLASATLISTQTVAHQPEKDTTPPKADHPVFTQPPILNAIIGNLKDPKDLESAVSVSQAWRETLINAQRQQAFKDIKRYCPHYVLESFGSYSVSTQRQVSRPQRPDSMNVQCMRTIGANWRFLQPIRKIRFFDYDGAKSNPELIDAFIHLISAKNTPVRHLDFDRTYNSQTGESQNQPIIEIMKHVPETQINTLACSGLNENEQNAVAAVLQHNTITELDILSVADPINELISAIVSSKSLKTLRMQISRSGPNNNIVGLDLLSAVLESSENNIHSLHLEISSLGPQVKEALCSPKIQSLVISFGDMSPQDWSQTASYVSECLSKRQEDNIPLESLELMSFIPSRAAGAHFASILKSVEEYAAPYLRKFKLLNLFPLSSEAEKHISSALSKMKMLESLTLSAPGHRSQTSQPPRDRTPEYRASPRRRQRKLLECFGCFSSSRVNEHSESDASQESHQSPDNIAYSLTHLRELRLELSPVFINGVGAEIVEGIIQNSPVESLVVEWSSKKYDSHLIEKMVNAIIKSKTLRTIQSTIGEFGSIDNPGARLFGKVLLDALRHNKLPHIQSINGLASQELRNGAELQIFKNFIDFKLL